MRQLLTLGVVAISVVLVSCGRTDPVSEHNQRQESVVLADDQHAADRAHTDNTHNHSSDAHVSHEGGKLHHGHEEAPHPHRGNAGHETKHDEPIGHGEQRFMCRITTHIMQTSPNRLQYIPSPMTLRPFSSSNGA